MVRIRPLVALLLAAIALAALPAAAHALVDFRSPSGNVSCLMNRTFVRCDIRDKDWSAPKPRGCEFDYGQGLIVQRGWRRGRVVCAGDTAINDGRRLAYGDTIRRGSLRCTSRESGMRCRNGRGAGFRIATEDYDLF